MDRLRYLYVQVTTEAELCWCQGLERWVVLQPAAENVAAIGDLDLVALRERRQVKSVRERRILEQEAVVSRDEDIRRVRVRQSFNQVDQLAQRVLDRLEYLALGPRLVPGRVDAVVVDVQHLILLVQLPQLVA